MLLFFLLINIIFFMTYIHFDCNIQRYDYKDNEKCHEILDPWFLLLQKRSFWIRKFVFPMYQWDLGNCSAVSCPIQETVGEAGFDLGTAAMQSGVSVVRIRVRNRIQSDPDLFGRIRIRTRTLTVRVGSEATKIDIFLRCLLAFIS
jgi:hypothetical protein